MSITIEKTYSANGVTGVVYIINGNRCSTLLGKNVEPAKALRASLSTVNILNTTRMEDIMEDLELQYQHSNGTWSDCADRTSEFLAGCVEHDDRVDSVEQAVELLEQGAKLRHSGDERWYSKCRHKPAPPKLEIESCVKCGFEGDWLEMEHTHSGTPYCTYCYRKRRSSY